jgi:outer membrane protein insertion porin family
MHHNKNKIFVAFVAMACCMGAEAQDKIIFPDVTYAATPRDVVIGGFNVSGMQGYEDYMLTGISGLAVVQHITLPGNEIPRP